jgi:hypothetical protein
MMSGENCGQTAFLQLPSFCCHAILNVCHEMSQWNPESFSRYGDQTTGLTGRANRFALLQDIQTSFGAHWLCCLMYLQFEKVIHELLQT